MILLENSLAQRHPKYLNKSVNDEWWLMMNPILNLPDEKQALLKS